MFKTSIKINLSIIIASVLLLTALLAFVVIPKPASAQFKDELCGGASLSVRKDNEGCTNPCTERNAAGDCIKRDAPVNNEDKLNNLIKAIVNIFSVIVGIVAVIMVIVGGFKFITSGGDSGRVSSAKQTVIYALIGLIIVALAQVIVRFILNKVA